MSGSAFARTVILVGLLTLAGCGGSKDNTQKYGVKGKIVDGNKPWTLESSSAKMPKLPPGTSQPPTAPGAPGGMIQLGFHSLEGEDVTYANVDPSAGTFVVIVKPGRYKISLSMGSMIPGASDPFGGKFTQDKTKIVRDVTREGEQITIDISKPTG